MFKIPNLSKHTNSLTSSLFFVEGGYSLNFKVSFFFLKITADNEAYFGQFAKVCAGDLNAMSAAIGGIVAQEVMKASSGKFSPIFQVSVVL